MKTTFNLDRDTVAALDQLAERDGTRTRAVSDAIKNELDRRIKHEQARLWIAETVDAHGGEIEGDRAWAAEVIARVSQ